MRKVEDAELEVKKALAAWAKAYWRSNHYKHDRTTGAEIKFRRYVADSSRPKKRDLALLQFIVGAGIWQPPP